MVSELIMIHRLMNHPDKKVLFILPYISIVNEKVEAFKKMLSEVKEPHINIFGFSGHHFRSNFENASIAVCTIEKANVIVNTLIKSNDISKISTIVIDEMHLIGD